MARRVLGLFVCHRRPHEPPIIPWQEFFRLVEEASKAQTKALTTNHAARYLVAPPGADRCQFIGRRGNECRNRAMRGATRCRLHGGLRQVPHHPATVAAYRAGRVHEAHSAKATHGSKSRPIKGEGAQPPLVSAAAAKQQVRDTLEPLGMYHCGPHARAGRHALRYGNPSDWQAWLAETHALALQERTT